ncbi:MAG: hypothetical protein L6264_12055 [Weeksellaceae bacterium]|nr:hypothetical protein [Bacteroidota bacterium]MCG2781672.1 hypothetical protein [Weeksellaceae bacterium]
MKLTFTICTLLFSANTLFSQSIQSAKASQIIEKSITSQGGREVLKNVKTLYTNLETVMDGRNVNWITKEMAPNKGSFEIVYQGRMVYKSFYDGKTGYDIINGEKKVADPDDFKDKNYRNHIMNALDYLDPNLYQLEYVGEEVVNDKECEKIKATLANGKVSFLYYEKSSGLMRKSEVVKNAENNSYSTVLYDDYKKFGDLIYETKQTFISDNERQEAKVVDLYYNKKISDKDFK